MRPQQLLGQGSDQEVGAVKEVGEGAMDVGMEVGKVRLVVAGWGLKEVGLEVLGVTRAAVMMMAGVILVGTGLQEA